MIRDFDTMLQELKKTGPRTIAVGAAEDKDVLLSVENARRLGIARAILTGNKAEIEKIAAENGIDSANYEIIGADDPGDACLTAVDLVRRGEAALPMKGFVDTSVMLKAVLNREKGLRGDGLISHVGVLKVDGFDRLFFISDSAMTIAPNVKAKADIIRNAVRVAHAFGLKEPKVAVLCAVEKVNSKMPATLDAEELTRMSERGEITGCLVKGPLQLDNAVSLEAARHKGICHPVAGQADILIAPDIEAGNILNKSMEYFARAEKSGVIMGARTPIILTSRASSDRAKLNSIALGLLVAGKE